MSDVKPRELYPKERAIIGAHTDKQGIPAAAAPVLTMMNSECGTMNEKIKAPLLRPSFIVHHSSFIIQQ